jgi:hypothetical protein
MNTTFGLFLGLLSAVLTTVAAIVATALFKNDRRVSINLPLNLLFSNEARWHEGILSGSRFARMTQSWL